MSKETAAVLRRAAKLIAEMDLDWARALVAQCCDAGVPCFVKQIGADPYWHSACGVTRKLYLRDRKGGDPAEWPEDLKVREYPATDIRVRSPACRGWEAI